MLLNINIFDVTDPISKLLGEWSSNLDIWSILLRITISILFAAIIGWERSTKRHAAGLRNKCYEGDGVEACAY